MVAKVLTKFTIIALLVATGQCSSGFASFSYGVSDPNTGDIKDQHEKRDGGNVVGKYSLLESDGTKRVVEYSASDATGFNAIVHKEPVGGAVGAIGALGPAGHAHAGLGAGSLAHGGLGVAAHGIRPAPIAAASPFAHGAPLAAAASPLTHGTHSALSYANSNIANPALAHGALGHGYGNQLTGGLASNLAVGHAGQAANAVSHYAHSIVHDVRPYAGAYAGVNGGYGGFSRYGGQATLAHGGVFGQGTFAHGGLASPLLNRGFGSSLGHGGWTPASAGGALGSPLAHGGPVSPFAHGGIGGYTQGAGSMLAHGARGLSSGWNW